MDDFDYVPGFNLSTAAPKLPDYELPEEKQAPAKRPQKQVKPESPALKALKTIGLSLLICTVIFSMLGSLIKLDSVIVENKKEIASLNLEIKQAKAESTRLNAVLGSMMSADKIQEYAVTVLGMQQAERYQIHYFEDRDGDKVVVADGKLS